MFKVSDTPTLLDGTQLVLRQQDNGVIKESETICVFHLNNLVFS